MGYLGDESDHLEAEIATLIELMTAHTHLRVKITDLFDAPFWANIPDKPSTFPVDPHTHLRADITDLFNTPFWASIPDKPSTFPPSSHTHDRSEITDFFDSPFWAYIPDPPSTFPPDSHSSHPSLSIDATEIITVDRILQNIASISQILKPTTDSSYDFGASDLRFKDIYSRELVLSKLSDQRYVWSCWDADELRLITYDGKDWRNPVFTIDVLGVHYFGLLKDVDLFRGGVDLLQTDDDFEAANLIYDTGLYHGVDRGIPTADIQNDAVTVAKLGHNIDATGIGFDADELDGYHASEIPPYVDMTEPTGYVVINSTERTSSVTFYTKKKEVTLQTISGTLNTYFEIKATSGYTAYGQIYRNGGAVGTERSTTSTTYVGFSESIAGFSVGDAYQTYIKSSTIGKYAYVQKQEILGTFCVAISSGY